MQLNKRARNREQLKKKTEALKLKLLSKEIDRYDGFSVRNLSTGEAIIFFLYFSNFFVFLFQLL